MGERSWVLSNTIWYVGALCAVFKYDFTQYCHRLVEDTLTGTWLVSTFSNKLLIDIRCSLYKSVNHVSDGGLKYLSRFLMLMLLIKVLGLPQFSAPYSRISTLSPVGYRKFYLWVSYFICGNANLPSDYWTFV